MTPQEEAILVTSVLEVLLPAMKKAADAMTEMSNLAHAMLSKVRANANGN